MTSDAGSSRATAAARERSFSWGDPGRTATAVASMSGIELLTAIARGELPVPPLANALGFELESIEPGRAVFTLEPAEFHYNPIGSVHGGVYASLLDSSAGCAVHSLLPVGVGWTSLDLAVRFLRPITVDTGKITSVGTVVHLGRRTALAEARLTDVNDRLLATATSSCLILRPDA